MKAARILLLSLCAVLPVRPADVPPPAANHVLIVDGKNHHDMASSARPLMKHFIGINGHTVQFKPDLYRPVCGLVRDYHPVDWDLGQDTSLAAPFPFAKNRVDWSQVYGSWRKQGWNTDVSLMFESIPRTTWKDISKDAAAYGLAFAREFGPSGTRKLVDSVEIGNEPGLWNDEDYINLFRSMAQGIRRGDPKLLIATCALTAGKSERYAKSAACLDRLTGLFDILSVHSYAQLENWPTWRRSFPEDPALKNYLQDIIALCQWRDSHAPGKPVWLTEFGYDSSTHPAPKSGDFSRWVGVTDTQQAQWLVRSLLVFSSLPLDRAYIYFFNDSDQPGLHSSSGITRNFQPKPSYHALAQLQQLLGEFRFERIVRNEPGTLRVQEYLDPANPKRIAWVAWSPTGTGLSSHRKLTGLPGTLTDIQTMRLTPLTPNAAYEKPSAPASADGTLDLEISESPVYLFISKP